MQQIEDKCGNRVSGIRRLGDVTSNRFYGFEFWAKIKSFMHRNLMKTNISRNEKRASASGAVTRDNSSACAIHIRMQFYVPRKTSLGSDRALNEANVLRLFCKYFNSWALAACVNAVTGLKVSHRIRKLDSHWENKIWSSHQIPLRLLHQSRQMPSGEKISFSVFLLFRLLSAARRQRLFSSYSRDAFDESTN